MLSAIVALVGCNNPVACTAISYNAVGLTVVDSVTGTPPSTATVVIFSGATFKDSLSDANGVYFLGQGRTGNFSILVRAAGYLDWSRNIHVGSDRCGKPRSVAVTARLQRAP